MVYQTIANNMTGIDDILVYTSTSLPNFLFMAVLTLYFIITIATYFSTRKEGRGDLISSSTVASLVCFIALVLLTLQVGVVSTYNLIFWLAIVIINFIVLFMSKDR